VSSESLPARWLIGDIARSRSWMCRSKAAPPMLAMDRQLVNELQNVIASHFFVYTE
jgi:hypothetical protein